jgi:hypothetical protein
MTQSSFRKNALWLVVVPILTGVALFGLMATTINTGASRVYVPAVMLILYAFFSPQVGFWKAAGEDVLLLSRLFAPLLCGMTVVYILERVLLK